MKQAKSALHDIMHPRSKSTPESGKNTEIKHMGRTLILKHVANAARCAAWRRYQQLDPPSARFFVQALPVLSGKLHALQLPKAQFPEIRNATVTS